MTVTNGEPVSAEPLVADGSVMAWAEALVPLAEARFYWLATVGPGGGPHIRPVLAVWVDGSMYSTTGPTTRKGRNLAADGRCSLTVRADILDIVLDGLATRVTDLDALETVAEAYRSKYGWPVTLQDGAFDAPYGAPTAGPPPYVAYRIRPGTVFAFGTDDTAAPRSTRWRF
jgi:hypothetical protein